MKKIKVGIIGCGRQSSHVFFALSELDNLFEVKYLCDLDNKNFEPFLDEIPAKINVKTTSNYEDVLKDTDIDAVMLFTPTFNHIEIASKVIDAKKDLLMEKPLGLDLKSIDNFIIKALNSKQIVQVELPFHYAYFFSYIKYLATENKLGSTKFISIREHRGPFLGDWFFSKDKSGGAINDKAIHFFDISNELFYKNRAIRVFASGSQHFYSKNMEISEITDTKVKIDNPDIVDNAGIIVEYEDNCILNVSLNMYQKPPIEGMDIDIPTLKGKYIKAQEVGNDFALDIDGKGVMVESKADNDKNRLNHPGVKELLRAFHNSIVTREVPSANIWLAREAQIIALAAEESIVSHDIIDITKYRNKEIDELAYKLGLTKPQYGEFHRTIHYPKLEHVTLDLIDSVYNLLRKIFPRQDKRKYLKVDKRLAGETVESLLKESVFRKSLGDINQTISLILPWVTLNFEISKGNIELLDNINTELPILKITVSEPAYFAALKDESIVYYYLKGDIKIEGDFSELQKDRSTLFDVIQALKSKCIIK